MSDHFSREPGQDDAALAPELARLDELLLAEGRRWRRNEPSAARLERHVQALARSGVTLPRNEERMLSERNQKLATSVPRLAPRRPLSRWRGLLAVMATVLLVAMTASVFAFLSGRSIGIGEYPRGAKSTPTPGFTRVAAIQPNDTHLPMPADAYLSDISFSSAHDGWAVGGIINSSLLNLAGVPIAAAQGVLVHYHDGVWTAASDSFPGIDLDSVSMISADDGWAVGSSAPNAATDTSSSAVLLHYTGGHWVMVKTPALANAHPRMIRMLSPDFGYITGQMYVVNANKSIDGGEFVAVYQNGDWKAIRVPFANASGGFTTQTVMVSASEGWTSALTVTPEKQQATIYHYLNGVWTKSLTFPGYVTSLSAASHVDVWALAVQCVNCTEPAPRIEHYNGTAWERVNPPSESDFTNIPGFGASGLISQFILDEAASGVWVSYTAYDTANPSSQIVAMWEYVNGDWRLMRQQVRYSKGWVVALTADGNGGLWAIVQAGAPPVISVLYTQGDIWKVYGRS